MERPVTQIHDIWPYILFLAELALKLGLICFILTRRQLAPNVALTWIVLMFVLPWVGMLAYLLIGEARIGRRRIRRHRDIVAHIHSDDILEHRRLHPLHTPEIPDAYRSIARLAEATADNPVRPGNRLRLIGDTDVFVQSLVEDIDAAERHCHLCFYIYVNDHSGRRVADALIRAAQRGVQCRVLVDFVGSKYFVRSHLMQEMRDAGVQVVAMLPVNPLRMALARIDLRNHRKLIVIDDAIGYVGSQNLSDPDFALKKKYAPWIDAMVRLDGPGVRDLQVLFVEDWYLDTDESLAFLLDTDIASYDDGVPVQVFGTGPNYNAEALRDVVATMFHAAREELILTTPYFIPDEPTLQALLNAARRGVDTTLVLPRHNDSPIVAEAARSVYQQVLEAGVHLLEFTDGLLHAKTCTIDRTVALVSTANLDRRSFELNFEACMFVYDSDFASQLRYLQKSYLNSAEPIELLSWRNRPWLVQLRQNAAGLLGPLL